MYNNMQQPYYNNYYNYNPMANAQQRLMQLEQQYPQFAQQNNFQNVQQQQTGIQGKIVSDFETVKATETPLDGSVSYFPLVNGDCIYTKFLNMNTGLSDYAIYKKVEQKQEQEESFNMKAYLDEKFETLKEELLNGGLNNARKSNKSNNKSNDEQRIENNN